MYSTCLFCTRPLGRNEAIEHFPVGRRLAYDPARGRLWVVCRSCGRWNLTPVEERWEAIEECERRFRDTRLRVSTDNIGLARLREGVELVRIGAPQRPEFAAWRYGDQFGRRRRKYIVGVTVGVGVGVAAVATGAVAAVAAAVPGAGLLWQVPNIINIYRRTRLVYARVPDGDRVRLVRGSHLEHVQLAAADAAEGRWRLRIRHDEGQLVLEGQRALDVASRVLRVFNRAGAWSSQVGEAVRQIEDAGGPQQLLVAAARRHTIGSPGPTSWRLDASGPGALKHLPAVERLAVEMAVHEEAERRALEGELAALEERWREAEEIAAIADDLLLPSGIGERLERLRRR